MSTGSIPTSKTLAQVARKVGTYPEEAYHFVREGLEYAARTIHGPMTPPQFVVAEYMCNESIDLLEVMERLEVDELDPLVATAVRQAGGFEQLNRNISGEDLCWGLRDFALRRWGPLSVLVLTKWNVHQTEDFGKIVFALVEHSFMQTEPHDSLEDFKSVYDFVDAFKRPGCVGERPVG